MEEVKAKIYTIFPNLFISSVLDIFRMKFREFSSLNLYRKPFNYQVPANINSDNSARASSLRH